MHTDIDKFSNYMQQCVNCKNLRMV